MRDLTGGKIQVVRASVEATTAHIRSPAIAKVINYLDREIKGSGSAHVRLGQWAKFSRKVKLRLGLRLEFGLI
ncbi:hypothetical protein CRG98_005593 [Punica granatum]|uniref:Uncharacterized protein n=1 Tax=Punica granatum TaxID=22663 RepID=A0A2I0L1H1_PUNGR|nr:hypothetical protein CRG98_005593 [Punica granatum]